MACERGWESDELRLGLDGKKIMEGFVEYRETFGFNRWAMGGQYIFYILEKQFFLKNFLRSLRQQCGGWMVKRHSGGRKNSLGNVVIVP